MRLLYKNTMISSLLIALSLMIVGSQLAQAQCTTVASCNTLGFDKDVSKCDTNNPILKCPSDISKAFCTEKANCTPVVGHIYYSDKSCSADYIVAKNPIGIIFDATNKLLVALDDGYKPWNDGSDNLKDIPTLTNFTGSSSEFMDTNGKDNTDKIIAFQNNDGQEHQAAKYCATYFTEGTSLGQWFLPSLGQLEQLYNVKSSVNTGLSKIGKTALSTKYYWSSTEHIREGAWGMPFTKYVVSGARTKDLNNYVRPVLAF